MKALGLLAVMTALSGQLSAQVAVHFAVGARYSGTLVHDAIVTDFDVRPTLAPVLAFDLQLPPHRGWTPGIGFDLSRSQLRRYDEDASTVDLGVLGALSFTVTLRRDLAPDLGARLTLGGLHYLPARESSLFGGGEISIFRGDDEAWRPLIGIALDWAPPPARARGLALELRTDVHRFLTRRLLDEGFTEHRLVPRVTLAVRAAMSR